MANRAIQSLLLHLNADIEYVSVDIDGRWKPTITGDVMDWKRIVAEVICLLNPSPFLNPSYSHPLPMAWAKNEMMKNFMVTN